MKDKKDKNNKKDKRECHILFINDHLVVAYLRKETVWEKIKSLIQPLNYNFNNRIISLHY